MSKTKKKRSKKYTGRDAKVTTVRVRKIEASNRGAFSQWIFEHKKLIKWLAIIIIGGGAFIFLMIQGFAALASTR